MFPLPSFGWQTSRAVALATILCVGGSFCGCERTEAKASDRELLASAWAYFKLSEFSEAQRNFARVIEQAKDKASFESRVQAEYGLAAITAMGSEADSAKAVPQFQQVINELPHSDLAGWSQLAMVRMTQQAIGTDTPDARKKLDADYRAVIETYRGQPPADEAFVHLQALRLIPLDRDAARQVNADITAYLNRGTRYVSALYNLRAISHQLCDEYQASFDDRTASIASQEKDPQNPMQIDAGLLYAMGVSAQFDLGDFATARQYYQRFLDLYPTEQRSFTVKLLMKNMDHVEASLPSMPAGAARIEVP